MRRAPCQMYGRMETSGLDVEGLDPNCTVILCLHGKFRILPSP